MCGRVGTVPGELPPPPWALEDVSSLGGPNTWANCHRPPGARQLLFSSPTSLSLLNPGGEPSMSQLWEVWGNCPHRPHRGAQDQHDQSSTSS